MYQDYIHTVPPILQDQHLRKFHKTSHLLTSVKWLQQLCKQTNIGTSTALTVEKLMYMHMTLHTPPTCDISVGSLMLLVPEAGDVVELFLLYCMQYLAKRWRIYKAKFMNILNQIWEVRYTNCNVCDLVPNLWKCYVINGNEQQRTSSSDVIFNKISCVFC